MYNFTIQTVKNDIIFDFAFHLKEAIKYNNWFYNEKVYDYQFCENIKNIKTTNVKSLVPIGSVEFVLDFYKTYFDINNIKPINIPNELNKFKFLKRKIFKGSEKNSISNSTSKQYFIKDISKIKGFTDIVSFEEIPNNRDVLASEEIEILNEWRCFIYKGELLDIRSYNTSCFVYPNIDIIKEMINEYKNSPTAYTIDVGITDSGETVLIEIHQFFSCGLYGFMDYRVLPNMFIATHKEIIKNKRASGF